MPATRKREGVCVCTYIYIYSKAVINASTLPRDKRRVFKLYAARCIGKSAFSIQARTDSSRVFSGHYYNLTSFNVIIHEHYICVGR
jgi:hypothetical protein